MTIEFEHRQATHCESGAINSLLHHHGLEVSEPMCFGIGGGLFFGYFPFIRMAHIKVTTFRKAPGAVVHNAFKRLGVRYKSEAYFRKASAQRRLDALLDAGKPSAVQVGFYWLPYIPHAFRTHFNAHHILVYGREGGTYNISEPGFDHPVTLEARDLEKARFARGGMNPRGRIYWLLEDRTPKAHDLRRPAVEGIKDVCFYMLTPPIPLLGIRGIRYLGRDILKWRDKLPEDQVRNNLNQIVVMQEVVGSGGAGFRYMYAAFLTEAAELFQDKTLSEAAAEMTSIGDRWRDFARVATRFIKNRPEPGDNYAAMAGMVNELADREERLYRTLWPWAKKWKGDR